jgi:hypothetical protein
MGVDCIRLSQDRDRWRDVVSAVVKLPSSCAAELVSVMENCRVFCEEQTEFLCYLDHRLLKMVLHTCSTDLLGSSLTVK